MKVSRTTIGLVALAALALGLRLATVMVLRTSTGPPEAFEHGRIAENLLVGRGFSIEFLGTEGRTSQQAPFYPYFLATAYRWLGVGTPEAILGVQLVQCVAGMVLVLAVVWMSWSLLPERRHVGWVAGLAAAFYPPHVYMVTHLQVAVWAALLLALLVAVVVSPRWRARWFGAIAAGALAGVTLLVEPILALALPLAAAAFWQGEHVQRWWQRFTFGPLARLALMVAVAAGVITPWMLRNRQVHGQWVFIKSTFGYAFWQGNNPASWGTDKVPKPSAESIRTAHDGTLTDMNRAMWEARHETLYIDDVVLKPGAYQEFRGLTEPQRSGLLGRRAWEFVRANPEQYALLCLNRLRYFLLFDATNPKAANRLYRLSTVTWLVLGLVGFLASLGYARRLWPTYAIFAAVTLFHTLVIVSVRFRIPVEPLSMIWAASVVSPLLIHVFGARKITVYRPGERAEDAGDEHALKGPHYRGKKKAKADRRAA